MIASQSCKTRPVSIINCCPVFSCLIISPSTHGSVSQTEPPFSVSPAPDKHAYIDTAPYPVIKQGWMMAIRLSNSDMSVLFTKYKTESGVFLRTAALQQTHVSVFIQWFKFVHFMLWRPDGEACKEMWWWNCRAMAEEHTKKNNNKKTLIATLHWRWCDLLI